MIALLGTLAVTLSLADYFTEFTDLEVRLSLYALLFFSCVFAAHKMCYKLGFKGACWLGAGYGLVGLGVPFFLRDAITLVVPDHTIWHILVAIGSFCHWWCILWHV